MKKYCVVYLYNTTFFQELQFVFCTIITEFRNYFCAELTNFWFCKKTFNLS